MAATTTTGFQPAATASIASTTHIRSKRRRRITPEAGHALELLGHAIEYLTDEFVHNGGEFSAKNEQLEAVQILMALNREIYFACPEVPSFAARCRAFLGFH